MNNKYAMRFLVILMLIISVIPMMSYTGIAPDDFQGPYAFSFLWTSGTPDVPIDAPSFTFNIMDLTSFTYWVNLTDGGPFNQALIGATGGTGGYIPNPVSASLSPWLSYNVMLYIVIDATDTDDGGGPYSTQTIISFTTETASGGAGPNDSDEGPTNGSTVSSGGFTFGVKVQDWHDLTWAGALSTFQVEITNNQTADTSIYWASSCTSGTNFTNDIGALTPGSKLKVSVRAFDYLHDYTFTYNYNVESGVTYHPPTFGTPSPVNSSTGQNIILDWSIPINDKDPDDEVYFTIECNNSQEEHGYRYLNTTQHIYLTGLDYSHPYKIWVNASDDDNTTRAWYKFTTKAPTYNYPTIGTPSPVNNTINQTSPFSWSIPINSTGSYFNWTIQCSNGQHNEANHSANGTKSVSLSGLALEHTYTVYVNATAGPYTTRRWYQFTTKDFHSPTFGTPNPVNNSIEETPGVIWTIPINDTGGSFNWTIQCSNGQSSSGNGAGSGTKTLILTGLLNATTYKILVNATDGVSPTSRAWYQITGQYIVRIYAGGNTIMKTYKYDKNLTKLAETGSYGSIIFALILDENNLYVGGDRFNGRIYQYTKSSLTLDYVSDRYGGADVNARIYAMAIDNTYIYAGGTCGFSGPTEIWQFWKSNLTYRGQTSSSLTTLQAITSDNTYVYGVKGNPSNNIAQFYRSNLSLRQLSPATGNVVNALVNDDLYVYAASFNKIFKFWKTNMTTKSTLTLGTQIFALTKDDYYIWAGCQDGTIHQYWKGNMTEKTVTYGYGGWVYALANDLNYVYAGGFTTQKVFQYWKTNMTKRTESASYGGDILALASETGTYHVTINLTTTPATSLTSYSATLNGNLQAGFDTCTVWFHYGLTTGYGTESAGQLKTSGPFSMGVTGLLPGKIYHFNAYATNDYLDTGWGGDMVFLSRPNAPTNVTSRFTPNPHVNFTFTPGTGSNRTVIVRHSTHYPTSPTDGVVVYNGTGSYYNASVTMGVAYYFSAFGFTSYGGYSGFSTNITHMSWGVIGASCYNESSYQPIPFNMLFSTKNGSFVKYYAGLSNTFSLNISEIITGQELSIVVSSTGYKQRTYIYTFYPMTFYNLSFYLPSISTPGEDEYTLRPFTDTVVITNPAVNSTINCSMQLDSLIAVEVYNNSLSSGFGGWVQVPSSYYVIGNNSVTILHDFLSANTTMGRVSYYYRDYGDLETLIYVFTILGPTTSFGSSTPLQDAFVEFKYYLNETDEYAIVSNGYSDSDGKIPCYMISYESYKIFVSKDGYKDTITDFIADPNIRTKSIRLEYVDTIPPQTNYSVSSIHLSYVLGYMAGNSTYVINLTYLDTTGFTNSTTLIVTAYNFTTNTSTVILTETLTNDSSWTRQIWGIDRNMTYKCVVTVTHYYLGVFNKQVIIEKQIWIPITPTEVNDMFAWMGIIPFGAVNLLMFALWVGICFNADSRDFGKYTIAIGIIFMFLGGYVGLHTPMFGGAGLLFGGAIPVLFIAMGILIEWNQAKRKVYN